MKFKKLIGKIAKWGLIITSPFWPLWITAPTELVGTICPNVKNRQEAYQILEEEKSRLGIQKPVDLRIYDNNELKKMHIRGYAGISSDGENFVIGANIGDLDRILLRHELYHIQRGDCTKKVGKTKQNDLDHFRMLREKNQYPLGHPKYFYLQEPRANIYSVTGIRL